MTQNDSAPKKKSRKGCIRYILMGLAFLLLFAFLKIPGFVKMLAKTKTEEAEKNLKSLFIAQNKFHEENGKYADHEDQKKCFDLLEWKPESANRYTYYCDTDVLLSQKGDHSSCPVPDVPPVTKDSFTIFAVANIDNDPACDIWSINDAGEIYLLYDDVRNKSGPLSVHRIDDSGNKIRDEKSHNPTKPPGLKPLGKKDTSPETSSSENR